MYAYAPDGTPIASTKEILGGTCDIADGGFNVGPDGLLACQHDSGTDVDYDAAKTAVVRGQEIVIDAEGAEWPLCAVIVLDRELDDSEDETLPQDKVDAATAAYAAWEAEGRAPVAAGTRTYSIDMPDGGYRHKDSFDADESRKLRPIAETLAMLDGNAFFGMSLDANGDDDHYRQYLPEAAALVEANGGWACGASFIRGDAPLPENPMGLVPVRTVGGERVVDLVDTPDRMLRLTGIDWDTSTDSEVPEGMTPHLPGEMLVGVDEEIGSPDNGYQNLVDSLTDRYDFCVNGIASVEPVTEPVDA